MVQVRDARARHLTVAVLILWFILALVGSLLGIFSRPPHPPILLGLAVVGSRSVVCAELPGTARSQAVRFVDRLAGAHGGANVASARRRRIPHSSATRTLPGVFAFPAGWGDIAIGVTAPVVAWFWRPPFHFKTFVVLEYTGDR